MSSLPVALGEQQRAQVGMVDPSARFRCDDGLGMERDAKPGCAQHVEVVRAVADRQRRGQRQSALGGQFA